MRLKKSISLLMAASISILSFCGCSTDAQSYLNEVQKVNSWDGISSSMSANVNLDLQGQKQTISIYSECYTNGNKAKIDIGITNLNNSMNFQGISMYTDGSMAYINKGYFEGIFKCSGLPLPEGLKNLNTEYIAIDTEVNSDAMLDMLKSPDGIKKMYEIILGDLSDVNIPINKSGNTFTLNMDSNQMVDLGYTFFEKLMNNSSTINNMVNLEMTKEEIAALEQAKQQLATVKDSGQLDKIKKSLEGSTLEYITKFAGDSYRQTIKLNAKCNDFGNVDLNIISYSKKDSNIKIVLPQDVTKMNMDEYINLFQ